jgi:hypothetical protein
MAGTPRKIAGPAFIAASATNIYTPPASTIYTVIRHIHIANVTGAAVSFNLWVGLSGGSLAGTELFKQHSIPANVEFDYYCVLRLDSTDFLTGLASAATSLVIDVEGEQVVV